MCCKPGCLVWNMRDGSINWWNYNALNAGRRKPDTVFMLNMALVCYKNLALLR
jgi:hypothetical protein